MSYEANRYSTVENFRVEEVAMAYFTKPNALYRPPQRWNNSFDAGFAYSRPSLPKGKFTSVDEALEAVRKAFHVRC